LVKFFGKTRKDTRKSKTAAAAEPAAANGAEPAPPPPARKTAAARTGATAARTAATTGAAKTTATRTRRAPAPRPPRRDWAAEAAAVPIGAPSPAPSSLAVAPSADDEAASPAKRRRGARGGRGRKKPGAAAPLSPAEAPPLPELPPLEAGTLEAVVAHQAAVLEQFTREIGATLKSLQAAISDLQGRAGEAAAAVTAPRVGIFVDVPNLIYAAERRKIDLDFGRVLDYFTRGRELVRATAYAPITDDPQARLESQRFAHHFIGHPYRIVTKPLKRFSDGSMKANFDIELAVDILTMSERLDVVVLMSGDGDFVRVVELVASRGVRVEVCAFAEAAATELRAVADRFIDIGQQLEEFKTRK
jgi:uncharacterized LabA/DUF88 family protein